MFPSSSNCDHFLITNQAIITENENPSSSHQHHQHPSPFLHFPSDQPLLADDNELFMNHFSSQQQILGCSSKNKAAVTGIKMESLVKPTKKATTKKKKNDGDGEKQAVPRKRTGKKDRHTKIYTAQGPRDRRMRLSLPIARKFFDLHDMLGFDKASKTIEWLFTKSKAAIKELTESLPSGKSSCIGEGKSLSSTSESEVLSGIKRREYTGDQKSALAGADSFAGLPRGAMNRKSPKQIINPIVRESREKARARARERTKEKMKMRGLDQKSKKCPEKANPSDLEQLGSSSPPQTAEKNCSLEIVAEEEEESCMVHLPEHEMDSVSIIEKFLDIATSPISSSIFDYTHNIGESSVVSSQQKHPVYTEYNSCCAMTNLKGSKGNLQAQNPGEIFNINPDTQKHESRSIHMSISTDAHEKNPSSDFSKAPSYAHEQNPSSIVMTSQPHFLEYQFSCNPIVDSKYCSLY